MNLYHFYFKKHGLIKIIIRGKNQIFNPRNLKFQPLIEKNAVPAFSSNETQERVGAESLFMPRM